MIRIRLKCPIGTIRKIKPLTNGCLAPSLGAYGGQGLARETIEMAGD